MRIIQDMPIDEPDPNRLEARPCDYCHGEGLILPATVFNEEQARAIAPECRQCDGTGEALR